MRSLPRQQADRSPFWPLLPQPKQTLLLRACLGRPEAVRSAWRAWCARIGRPRDAILEDRWGIKSMLPLLADSLQRAGVGLEKELQTALKAACLREQLRLTSIRRVCRQVFEVLGRGRIEFLVAGDLAAAEWAYAEPALRHCGRVQLLGQAADVDRAAEAIRAAGEWSVQSAAGEGLYREVRLAHRSGLTLHLSSRLLHTPSATNEFGGFLQRSIDGRVGDTAVRLPAPADLLLGAMEPALLGGSWRDLQWCCDAAAIVSRCCGSDWQTVVDLAKRNSLAAPLLATFAYLRDDLAVPVPPGVQEALAKAAGQPTAASEEVRRFCLSSTLDGNLVRALRAAGGTRQRAHLVAAVFGARWREFKLRVRSAAIKRPWLHRIARVAKRCFRFA